MPTKPKSKRRFKFTISRRKWLRGEGPKKSRLLRARDGKMCCVGIYLKALGVCDSALRGKSIVDKVRNVPDEAKWLEYSTDTYITSASSLYAINDFTFTDKERQEQEREFEIKQLFKKAGIDVTFKP